MNRDEDKEGFKIALLFLSSPACVNGPVWGRREGRGVRSNSKQYSASSARTPLKHSFSWSCSPAGSTESCAVAECQPPPAP